MIIQLKSDSSMAQIETKGAELLSFQDVFGTEYMWQRDPKHWGKTSPVLFPTIGNMRDGKAKINGEYRDLPKHGFCREHDFKIMYQSESKVILTTGHTEETLKIYPFKFSLSMTYTLDGGNLAIGYTVLNLGDSDMYYCLGAHPAFNVPTEEFGCYELIFNKDETTACPVYSNEILAIEADNRVNLLKGGNKLRLSYELFDNDALIFDQINSDSVKLCHIKTGRGVQVNFDGFENIAFWTPVKLHSPFLCIEPWNGMAVRTDEGDDFEKKHSVQKLAAGEQINSKIDIIPL